MDQAPMTPAQIRTFNELLAMGMDRPYTPPGLVEKITSHLEAGLAAPLHAWTEGSMWLSKAQLFAALGCEVKLIADRERNDLSSPMHPATAQGLVTHRAIQLSHTHPMLPIESAVTASVTAACGEERFGTWWAQAGVAAQSDLISGATSMVVGFLDSWPRLHPTWAPRFEESVQAKVGRLTLGGRVDLMLGRPRADLRQTMMIVDWKSGALGDHHADEAAFYALVATLRHGVPPFRSTIYSLASGEWTEPDVTPDMLMGAADKVIAAVTALVATMTDARPPVYRTSKSCRWCPLAPGCPQLAAEAEESGTSTESGPEQQLLQISTSAASSTPAPLPDAS